jgi:hypothetical protein
MKHVFLLAERMDHIKNWAKHYKIDLPRHPNIRWVRHPDQVRGVERDGYFVVISPPKDVDRITGVLENGRGYTHITSDLTNWPLDAFG